MANIPKDRLAVYEEYEIPPEARKRYEKQLSKDLEKLRATYKIDPALTVAAAKTEILRIGFKASKAFDERNARVAVAREKHSARFQQIFGVPLSKFMRNPYLGFDTLKLDDEVVKSPEDRSMRDTIRERYGVEALAIVEELMGKETTCSS